jgi:acyl dehydratase
MGLYFEEIELNQPMTTAARTITEADVVSFCGLSGDFNPLHTDEEFARSTPYGTRIAHGPLVLCAAMGLMNRTGFSDGSALGFLGIERWNFVGPVKLGDTIHVRFEVTDKRESSKGGRGIVRRAVSVINQRDEVVQEGEMVTMIAARPAEVA